MKWRVAKALLTLRDQVNARFPERDKSWDGTIGDTAHSSRKSDHNPNEAGVVCAMDITHDPENGVDSYKMAEQLRLGGDSRIKYVISNKKIFSSTQSPWVWRKYSGSNPHDHHVHISVKSPARYYDDTAPWELSMLAPRILTPEVAEDENEEVGDDDYSPRRALTAASISETTDEFVAKAKPLLKSKITWAQIGAGILAFFGLSSQTDLPASLVKLKDFIQSPGFILLGMLALLGLTIYWRWKDHGKGVLS